MVEVENHDISPQTQTQREMGLWSKVSAQLGLRAYQGGDSWGEVDHGRGEFGQSNKKETNTGTLQHW